MNEESLDAHAADLQGMVERGLELHRAGRLRDAQAIYETVLAVDPEQPDALHLSGVVDSQSGNPGVAVAKIGRAIAATPGVAIFHTNLANALLALGRANEALASYARAIELDHRQTDAHAGSGKVLADLGRFDEAIACFDAAIAQAPAHAQALNGKGNALQRQGRLDEAIGCYDAALAADPRHPQARLNRGRALTRLDRHADAERNYRAALEVQPQSARLHLKLADAVKAQGRDQEAVACYDDAIACPDSGIGPRRVDAAAWNNRGNALRTLGRTDDAIESFGKTLEAAPEHVEAWFNLGNALKAQHRYHSAIACYDRVLQLRPDHAVSANNRGVALGALGRIEASIESLDLAIAADPDNPEPPWNKGIALLLSGDFERGWPLYEKRWTNDNTGMKRRSFERPLWLGEQSISGRTVLLHAEQGFGDTLQFCRLASSVAKLGARVVLEVPAALKTILRGLEGVSVLLARGEPLPEFDLHCPLLSLPLALGIHRDEIPCSGRYLHAPEERCRKWNDLIGARSGPRIGIVWSGNPGHGNDHNRSVSLARLVERLPQGPEYFSLQRDCRVADRAALAMNPGIRHFGEALVDFADTAGICEAMDLVISVDTSVAHLSAALGRPTWILLPFVPDWRWMTGRDDSPWYSSARLFRQPRIGDWDSTLMRLRAELETWLDGTAGARASGPMPGRSAGIDEVLRLQGEGRLDAASEAAQGMLSGDPDDFDAAHALAVLAAQRGKASEAVLAFDRALGLRPDNAQAWSNRGHALRADRRLDEAVRSYDRAIALLEPQPAAWLGKALALADLGELEAADACFDRAIALDPDDAQARALHSTVLRRLDRLDESLAALDRAVAIRPDDVRAWDRRGLALEALGRLDDAIESHDRALALDPGDARAARNKGMALLSRGELEQGFRLYERRWNVEPMASAMPAFPRPRWLGDVPLEGRTLLLHSEQGLGDTIQFCRYAALAQARGAKVLLEVPDALRELMGTLAGVDRLVRRGEDLPRFDLHSPLMSLPFAFRTTAETIPGQTPYLSADPARVDAWRDLLGRSSWPTIGLAWRGNPQHSKDTQRSIALGTLLPHLPRHARYVALQPELRAADREAAERSGRVRCFGERIASFAETAALCAAVDLVVSVDTSVAHLSGALGLPTWILLPFAPDWRWMRDREDSPWYPTARLYRQRTRGDWSEVLRRLSADIARQAKPRPRAARR